MKPAIWNFKIGDFDGKFSEKSYAYMRILSVTQNYYFWPENSLLYLSLREKLEVWNLFINNIFCWPNIIKPNHLYHKSCIWESQSYFIKIWATGRLLYARILYQKYIFNHIIWNVVALSHSSQYLEKHIKTLIFSRRSLDVFIIWF